MKKEERESFAISYTRDENYMDKGPASDKKVEIKR